MLFRGALEALAIAKGTIERNHIELRTVKINKTIDILINLKSCLNEDAGGNLASDLGKLYNYMVQQLIEANRSNSAELVSEVAGLLREIANGWAEIPPALHEKR